MTHSRDRFNSGENTQAAAINAVLTVIPATIEQIRARAEERYGLPIRKGRVQNHLRALEGKGFACQLPNGDWAEIVIRRDRRRQSQLQRLARTKLSRGYFDANSEADERRRVTREVVQRRGQPAFRNALLSAYGGRCAITRCDAEDALEAAHIKPYQGDKSDHVTNGLLLRADVHALFDLDLIGIDPGKLTVAIARRLRQTTYSGLEGVKLAHPDEQCDYPNSAALTYRWGQFIASCDS